ncbi:MAG: NUDIX hydrolase [Candidatus Omnitrophica bacterium]|nr:NUDIX hydrolase [Candidatus Omnitrophota bacterium]
MLQYGPFVTVDAIIEINGKIVVIERSNPPFGYALPGGFVDYGESLEDAVTREAKEETGLKLLNLKQFHTYSNPYRDPRFHTIGTVFTAKGKGKPKAGDDACGLRLVSPKEIGKLTFAFDHKKIIQDYLKTRKIA